MPRSEGSKSSRPLTIFGGTFDPIHFGHLHAISSLRRQMDLGELLVIPAGAPWQKSDRQLAPGIHRLAMCRLAFAGDADVSVSDLEILRDGPTFTIDTVEQLKNGSVGADRQINLIVGADSLMTLHTWHRYEDLIKSVHIIVCARPEYPVHADQLPTNGFTLIEISALPISSSLVRERLKKGESVTEFLPITVWKYIVDHDLYGIGAR
ncbi:MAG TPA: nicotinate-nucleotide adenylyltransferase [Candidatus Nanopelagicaceae bacterium]|nr:nicotinate-nucleotide adenylyltransferase [Candidatus Nanopelagicaceae bacterium]